MISARSRSLTVAVTVALVLAMLATPVSPTATAQVDQVTDCLAAEGLDDPGTAMPVLLVHGWRGTTSQWDVFADRVDSFTDRLAVSRFDYASSHRQWVTHDQVAPKLRRHVLCLADVSQVNGGIGRVGIVGHSMGGLATREALADGPDGRGLLNDEVAFVATFGTPHAGPMVTFGGTDRVRRFASSLLRLGDTTVYDRERLEWISSSNPDAGLGRDPAGRALRSVVTLDALPTFPDQVPVLSVAGNYVERPRLAFYTGSTIPLGDAVVSASSATGHARELDRLGGVEVHECVIPGALSPITGSYEAWLTRNITGGPLGCYHGRLTQIERVTQTALTHLLGASTREPRSSADGGSDGELEVSATHVGPFPMMSLAAMEGYDRQLPPDLRVDSDDVVDYIDARLGSATEDSGWVEDGCLQVPTRWLAWDGFRVTFRRWPTAMDEHIDSWAAGVPGEWFGGPTVGPEPIPPGVSFDSPVQLGDTADQVTEAHPDANFESVHGAPEHFWTTPERSLVEGLVSDPPEQPGSEVVTLGANYPWLGC